MGTTHQRLNSWTSESVKRQHRTNATTSLEEVEQLVGLAERERRGLTSVRENRSHWRHHIEPVVRTKPIAEWAPVDMRELVPTRARVDRGELHEATRRR